LTNDTYAGIITTIIIISSILLYENTFVGTLTLGVRFVHEFSGARQLLAGTPGITYEMIHLMKLSVTQDCVFVEDGMVRE
jgi:hypothetical protein